MERKEDDLERIEDQKAPQQPPSGWKRFLGFFGRRRWDLILAALGLIIGAYHVHELQKMRATQYLGTFPDFLPDIAAVTNGARRHLSIACDFPGYADFTDPRGSRTYTQIVEKKHDDVSVEFICMNVAARQKYLDEQFPKAEWDRFREDGAKVKKVERFQEAFGLTKETVGDREGLFRLMNQVDDKTLQFTFRNRAIQTPVEFPIYFWIADCREAVFSIATPKQDGIEHGFYTKDRSLIKALLDLRDRYVKNMSPVPGLQKPCG